jgi:carbonic anhydrase/acetyltransferase-like protein (isoleucine patch superfamily)
VRKSEQDHFHFHLICINKTDDYSFLILCSSNQGQFIGCSSVVNFVALSTYIMIMALIKEVNGKTPVFGKDCFLAENATVVGDVVMGDQCSVWFTAVVRGDVHYIKIGQKVNIQDGAILHCTYQKAPLNIGNNVSIGHRAMVHGCTIHDNVLIGMGSIVMDGCVVESNSIIAAGAVLLEGTHVESGSVYAGIPAKKVKTVSKELFEGEIQRIANNYVMYSSWFS